jgi:hypothetical protein
MSRSDNLDNLRAINTYMMATHAETPSAITLKDAWVKWYNEMSWYDATVNINDTYDLARNRRLAFNLANARTSAEKQAVQTQATEGMSTEQQQGKDDRRTSTGTYDVAKPPLIPTAYKVAAAATGAGVATLVVLKKLHVL